MTTSCMLLVLMRVDCSHFHCGMIAGCREVSIMGIKQGMCFDMLRTLCTIQYVCLVMLCFMHVLNCCDSWQLHPAHGKNLTGLPFALFTSDPCVTASSLMSCKAALCVYKVNVHKVSGVQACREVRVAAHNSHDCLIQDSWLSQIFFSSCGGEETCWKELPGLGLGKYLHLSCCRIRWLQNGAEELLVPAWQASPRAHETQPLSYSMQLHPAIDTDAGSIAAADGRDNFMHAHAQCLVPAAAAAQSSSPACCSVDEACSGRCSSPDQLHDGEDGVHCGQVDQSERRMGQFERQSRSGSGPSHKQHGATSSSESSIVSKRSSKRQSNQQQHSAFRGVDATDHCSAGDSAGVISHSVGQSHDTGGSSSARPDGKSPFGSMQQTRLGQADSSLSPLKVRFRVSAGDSPSVNTVQWQSICALSSCALLVYLSACDMMLLSAMWQYTVPAAAAAHGKLANMYMWGLLGVLSVSSHFQALMHCNHATQVGAVSSANSAIGYPARLALQRISNVSPVHRNHACPRSMSRQSVFLGQPAALQPEGWNASIKPQSPKRCQDTLSSHPVRPTTAGSSGRSAATSPVVTPRHVAVVCKAVGFSKPKVPSLSLAALQADRHHLNVQTSHRKVYYLTHIHCCIVLHTQVEGYKLMLTHIPCDCAL